MSDENRAYVVNPEAIGDPNQTPIVRVDTDDDCPMHSQNWLYAAVRNNRRLSDMPPQECICVPTESGVCVCGTEESGHGYDHAYVDSGMYLSRETETDQPEEGDHA